VTLGLDSLQARVVGVSSHGAVTGGQELDEDEDEDRRGEEKNGRRMSLYVPPGRMCGWRYRCRGRCGCKRDGPSPIPSPGCVRQIARTTSARRNPHGAVGWDKQTSRVGPVAELGLSSPAVQCAVCSVQRAASSSELVLFCIFHFPTCTTPIAASIGCCTTLRSAGCTRNPSLCALERPRVAALQPQDNGNMAD